MSDYFNSGCSLRSVSVLLTCLLLSLPLCFRAGAADHVPAEHRTLAQIIVNGFRANRENLDYFSCRFQIREGRTYSESSALRGEFETSYLAHGLWIHDGRRNRFEIAPAPGFDHRPSELKTRAGASMASFPMLAERVLDDGLWQLRVSLLANIGNLIPPDYPKLGLELTPLDMGVLGRDLSLSPAALLESALRGRGYAKAVTRAGQGGTEYVVEYGDEPDQVAMAFVLDSAKGFMPRKVTSRDPTGKVVSTLLFTDFIETPGGGWYPKRGVHLMAPEEGARVREFLVHELDTSERPPESDFVIEVPHGVLISDPTKAGAQARLRGGSYSLYELESLRDRIHAAAFPRTPDRQGILTARTYAAIIIGGLAVLGLGAYVWRRNYRRA